MEHEGPVKTHSLTFAALVVLAASAGSAATPAFKPRAVFHSFDNETTVVQLETVRRPDGGYAATIKKESVPLNTQSVEVMCDKFFAKKGDAGYWIKGRGELGLFDRASFCHTTSRTRVYMPYYGWKNPSGTYLAIVEGMRFDFDIMVCSAKDGLYRAFPRWNLDDLGTCGRPFEDMTVVFYDLGPKADYNDMAKCYRRYKFAQEPELKTIKERAKTRPHLLQLAKSIPVRREVAHKPFDRAKDVKNYTPETEFPVRCTRSFAQVREDMRQLKEAGVEDVAVCLAAWQTGGYDGRVPAIFPVEEVCGGEAELRKTIAYGQSLGWIVDTQNNYTDCYTVSPMWDGGNIACMGPTGKLEVNGSWRGGIAHNICLRHAWETYLPDQMKKVRDLGFWGSAYIDVFTATWPYRCCNPNHPANRTEQGEYQKKIVKYLHTLFGGFSSECSFDHLLPYTDYINYVSAPMRSIRRTYLSKGKPSPVNRFVPFFELAFHDVVLSNPDKITQEVIKQPENLILVEFGGRPIFYRFDEKNIPGIRKAWDQFVKLRHLQLEEMVEHKILVEGSDLVDGFARVTYGNGEKIYVNHTDKPQTADGVTVPPMDFRLVKASKLKD